MMPRPGAPVDCTDPIRAFTLRYKPSVPPQATSYVLPKEADVRERPLWSSLSHQERQDTIDVLRSVYTKLPPEDKRSLISQAWLHCYYCSWRNPGEDVHSNWNFLPWHRAFLYFHERIIRKVANRPDFRLPVWDWENEACGDLPDEYYDLNLETFKYVKGYLPTVKLFPDLRKLEPKIRSCNVAAWLYGDPDGFIGGAAKAGDASSGLHSYVHSGLHGLMADIPTAGLHPVFYAHHAAVDRMWDRWWHENPGRRPESDSAWYGQNFVFYDENQNPVSVQTKQFVSPEGLGYVYPQDPVPEILYDSISATGGIFNWLSPEGKKLTAALVGAARVETELQGMSLTVLKQLGGDTAKFAEATRKLDALTEFPVRVTFSIESPKPGIYLVGIKPAAKGCESFNPPPAIGAFGVPGGHQHSGPTQVTACLCIRSHDLKMLTGKCPVVIYYQAPDLHSMMPENGVPIVILTPRGLDAPDALINKILAQ
jgi:hypothetical protein